MRVIHDLCNFMRVVSFAGKSVKKIVGVDYCIDVCIGGNDPMPSRTRGRAHALITSPDIWACIFI